VLVGTFTWAQPPSDSNVKFDAPGLINPNYGLTSSILPLREMDGLPGL